MGRSFGRMLYTPDLINKLHDNIGLLDGTLALKFKRFGTRHKVMNIMLFVRTFKIEPVVVHVGATQMFRPSASTSLHGLLQ